MIIIYADGEMYLLGARELYDPFPDNNHALTSSALHVLMTADDKGDADMKKQEITRSEESLKAYEDKQAEIEKLLKQIAVGLQAHDRKASGQGGHHWGHVGDLTDIAVELREISDRLNCKGEYAK